MRNAESGRARELSNQQRDWLQKASREDTNGWVYLHIEGTPVERGFQHGYLLAREIARSVEATRKVWRHDSGMEWHWLLAKSRRFITPRVDSENLAEIEGIAEGIETSPLLIILTYRPEYAHKWAGKSYYTAGQVEALNKPTAERLVRAILGNE